MGIDQKDLFWVWYFHICPKFLIFYVILVEFFSTLLLILGKTLILIQIGSFFLKKKNFITILLLFWSYFGLNFLSAKCRKLSRIFFQPLKVIYFVWKLHKNGRKVNRQIPRIFAKISTLKVANQCTHTLSFTILFCTEHVWLPCLLAKIETFIMKELKIVALCRRQSHAILVKDTA